MAGSTGPRARPGKGEGSAAGGKETPAAGGAKKAAAAKKPTPWWQPFGLLALVFGAGIGPWYYRYGANLFISRERQMLSATPAEWQAELGNHTLLIVGGPHRGGTSLLWELVSEDDNVASFGSSFDTGADHSEGVFLQDLLPQYGIGSGNMFATMVSSKGRNRGLGQYALGEREAVSWTEENRADMITEKNQARLFNQWGFHWKARNGFEKKFWIEKSPTNAVYSRFVQGVVDLGVEKEAHIPGLADRVPWQVPRDSRAKFFFIMRHPIANALAHRVWPECKDTRLLTMVENWGAIATYIDEDMRRLHNAMVVRLEDLTDAPEKTLADVYAFAGLPPRRHALKKVVKKDVNAKYEKKYCKLLMQPGQAGADNLRDHLRMKIKVGRIAELYGYDMDEWHCVYEAEVLQGIRKPEDVPPRKGAIEG